ncbi:phospholipase/Carboxylesterase [Diaporthe helianthi]|uniref:Phospholipase/Carboxylesterase n=1 Tax=Diaporthe helianthi TaxID=158607 RepID=A0A2P5HGT6_DIAHE|nr:phospholipase/Carboxylesterase [Diaporthe helianthi]
MPPTHAVGPADGHAHIHTIIFLHGRDSTGAEFADELFESEASEPKDQPRTLRDLLPTVRWVFPEAQVLPSARFGTDMAQWFDMWSTEDPDERPEFQLGGLRASVAALGDVVREEERLVPRGRIFVGGISQGIAVAVAAFFAEQETWSGLGGMVGLCGWLPLRGMVGDEDGVEQLANLYRGRSDEHPLDSRGHYTQSRALPTFLAHSKDDGLISIRHGRALRDSLRRFSDELWVEWHEYEDGGHWLNEPRGVDDLVAFLRKRGLREDT